MVLLLIAAFIEIYEHAHLDTRTHPDMHIHTLTFAEMGKLERQLGMEGGRKAREIGGEGNL